jgi:hypothetical protein
MKIEDFLGTPKEIKLAIDGTAAVLEFVCAVYLTSWLAGFLGIYFLYQAYKTMKTPGEIRLKAMIITSVAITVIFVSLISLFLFLTLGSLDG